MSEPNKGQEPPERLRIDVPLPSGKEAHISAPKGLQPGELIHIMEGLKFADALGAAEEATDDEFRDFMAQQFFRDED